MYWENNTSVWEANEHISRPVNNQAGFVWVKSLLWFPAHCYSILFKVRDYSVDNISLFKVTDYSVDNTQELGLEFVRKASLTTGMWGVLMWNFMVHQSPFKCYEFALSQVVITFKWSHCSKWQTIQCTISHCFDRIFSGQCLTVKSGILFSGQYLIV